MTSAPLESFGHWAQHKTILGGGAKSNGASPGPRFSRGFEAGGAFAARELLLKVAEDPTGWINRVF
eukprot:6225743-Pyramimonas_sp.AAC.1